MQYLAVPQNRSLTLVTLSEGWMGIFKCTDESCSSGTGQFFRFNGTSWNFFQDTGLRYTAPNRIRFIRGEAGDGWALSGESTAGFSLLKFQGTSWQPDPGSPGGAFLTLWMSGLNDLWLAGFGKTLYRFDGYSWNQLPLPEINPYFAINGLHFYDSNHGIGVGSLAGYQPTGPQTNVIYFNNGVWRCIPLLIPQNLLNPSLLEARMVSTNEAWAIGRAEDIVTGDHDKPILVHLWLPDVVDSAVAATSAVKSLAGMPQNVLKHPPSINHLEVRVVQNKSATIGVGVSAPCFSAVTIYTSEMRPVKTFTFTSTGDIQALVWDLRDEGTMSPVADGWYIALAEAIKEGQRAMASRSFLIYSVAPKTRVIVTSSAQCSTVYSVGPAPRSQIK
jgi:hypothetical protein